MLTANGKKRVRERARRTVDFLAKKNPTALRIFYEGKKSTQGECCQTIQEARVESKGNPVRSTKKRSLYNGSDVNTSSSKKRCGRMMGAFTARVGAKFARGQTAEAGRGRTKASGKAVEKIVKRWGKRREWRGRRKGRVSIPAGCQNIKRGNWRVKKFRARRPAEAKAWPGTGGGGGESGVRAHAQ